jgi:hypothetical protein
MVMFSRKYLKLFYPGLFFMVIGLTTCNRLSNQSHETLADLNAIGLKAEVISAEDFFNGREPANFSQISGAAYKPSYNEDPGIPAQCWIETGYGTQNACKYCHTDYLTEIKHGNAFPIAEDQEFYSFPTANLNRILWQNIIYPQNIERRLVADGIAIPDIDDLDYIRKDNWMDAYSKGRGNGNDNWINNDDPDNPYALFPALNPRHLFPYNELDPTGNGSHGYVDNEGFVRDETDSYTGWRAINFFPYAIFTPLSGSVSGIYIRLPRSFMTKGGEFDTETYAGNLDILEKNIKNRLTEPTNYLADAAQVPVKKGFYPVGTEFAHPLHYVDLLADGEAGNRPDGVVNNETPDYEFPGTRSKRIKEIRYMYKWKDVDLEDIALEEEESDEPEFEFFYGREGQGWVDNGAGWILAAYIENRHGELRPQTTEELTQCVGCHAKVGNTIDAVWSFQRKIPGKEGWADMHYGHYNRSEPEITRLHDYFQESSDIGEQADFYHSVVGADLYGIMSNEIRSELAGYAENINAGQVLGLSFSVAEILDDEILKDMDRENRKPRLLERQKLMRHYSRNMAYLNHHSEDDNYYLKGNIFFPTEATMKANVQGYRKIVLDQSFNLGKDVFGSQAEHVPFTFRSDGTVLDELYNVIQAGGVIYSRPYDEDGVGITPTGITVGQTIDKAGNPVPPGSSEAVGQTGTLDNYYNPILGDIPVRK